MKPLQRSAFLAWMAGVMLAMAVLGGCAAGLVRHHFSFDAREEPGIEILDYRYGDSRQPGASADRTQLRDGKVSQAGRMGGDIRRPDSLYVRWRVQPTATVHEDFVDLARLLPRDITDHRIHFSIRGERLFVYLITPNRRAPNEPALGPPEFRNLKVILLSSNFGRPVTAN